MKPLSLVANQQTTSHAMPGPLDALARRLVLAQLGRLQSGSLLVSEQGQRRLFGDGQGLSATLTVNDPEFWSDIAFGGSVGAGEAYMRGAWDCSDLVALVRILLRNYAVIEGMEGGGARLARPLGQVFQWLHRNTRQGARRNIAAHYDLGNEFFALWLDPTMMYSSAIFTQPGQGLHEAQLARLEIICSKLDLCASDHLVEIGTGWGALAIHAARNHGCRVTTTTISQAQFEFTLERVRAAGLQDRIEVLLQDYRDLTGRFDKLVSIEMIEAIGWRQYPEYFRKCGQLLRPGGRLLIQAITIAENRYEQARHSVDFIQRHIFPGSNLPSVSAMINAMAQQTDLMVTGLEDIGLHYATTLNHWRRNFHERLPEVRALGYPESFIRMWDYYLAYCEGGFLERAIGDVHLLAERP